MLAVGKGFQDVIHGVRGRARAFDDDINGRVRQQEIDVAILKDRGTRDPVARWASGIGSGAALVLVAVWEYLKGK